MLIAPPLTPGHHIVRTSDDLSRMVREVSSAHNRAFDFETDGTRYAQGKRPIGYALGYIPAEGGWPRAFYVPFAHRTAEAQISPDHARQAFNDALAHAPEITGHNLRFDLNMGRAAGFEIPELALVNDTILQAWHTYERRSLRLEDVAANEGVSRWADAHEAKNVVDEFLRQRAKKHRLPFEKDKKREQIAAYKTRFGHSEVPIDIEGEYSCRDVSHALCLDARLRPRAMGVGTQWQDRMTWLYYSDMMLVRALAEMEWVGQLVDKDYLWQTAYALEAELEQRAADLTLKFGVPIDWSKDEQIRRLLYEHFKFPVVKLTKGDRFGNGRKPAVDREALMSLRSRHPAMEDLAEYRARQKVLQSFTYSLAWEAGDDNYVHPSFLPFGTASGRLSGREPNFQNLPSRHKELSKLVRRAWVIPEGRVRLYVDYSQIELRMLAWITGARVLTNAYRSVSYDALLRGDITYDEYRWYRRNEPAVDVHGNVAKEIFRIDENHPDWKRKRGAAKIVNFGVPYGGGVHLLTSNPEVGMDETEAGDFLRAYHAGAPEIERGKKGLFRKMLSMGGTPYFVNWAGLKVHGPGLRSKDDDQRAEEERSMFACLVQGSAGLLTRISLVQWYRRFKEGTLPAVASSTVHDEIQFDCDEKDLPYVASECQRIMEDTFRGQFGDIPIIADLEVSRTTWADKQEYDFWA